MHSDKQSRRHPDAATPDAGPGKPVGRQIRELRRSRALTLSDMAERVGRSVGHLSQLERGVSPITLDTLDRIARTLDVSISWFFSAPDPETSPESAIVVRRDRRRQINLSRAGVREELLSPNLTSSLEMVLTTFAPGASNGEGGRMRKGDEGGFVITGQLEIRTSDQTVLLEAGDSFQLEGVGRQWCRNPADEDAVIVWSFASAHF